MKRFFKSSISILLTLVLAFSVVIIPSAEETAEIIDGKCTCGEEPEIYVAALGSATLYLNAGTDDEKIIFRPETSAYIELIAKLIGPLFSLLLTKDYDAFADKLIPAVNGVFGALANDEEGNSTPEVTTKEELPTDPTHGLEGNYYFGYDFRADPLVTADKFNEYVNHVLELTGHDQVRLRASSMGGVVTMSYLYKYGTEKVKSVILQCCPIQGTAVAGDLFNGRIMITEDSVYRYAQTALPSLLNGFTETFVMGLVNIVYKSGFLGSVLDMVQPILDNCAPRVFDELLVPVFKSNCGIWSFVPDAYYESAKTFMLGENPNAVLEARIDEYHYNVQSKAGEILNGVLDSGVPVMIVAGTAIQRTPLVPTWKNDSDGTVDTKYASVGGTVAELGTTLGDDYVQAIDDGHNHISPDNRIDASTCVLPDNTWFVTPMLHSTTHDGHGEMYRWFFENDDEGVNVFSNPDYPQFLENDIDAQKLVPQK